MLPMYANVVTHVSDYCLQKVRDEVLISQHSISTNEELDACTGSMRTIYGFPCKHECRTMLQEGKTLSLTDFHERWHIERRAEAELPRHASIGVLPPSHMPKRKKRAKRSDGRIKRVDSGGRILSTVEIARQQPLGDIFPSTEL